MKTMEFKDLIGKTITGAIVKKLAKYDDEGFLQLQFYDGTEALIIADYAGWTGKSKEEHPTTIEITDKYDGDLIDVE
jgi:hypothetical protein